jgi:hypothetical protein
MKRVWVGRGYQGCYAANPRGRRREAEPHAFLEPSEPFAECALCSSRLASDCLEGQVSSIQRGYAQKDVCVPSPNFFPINGAKQKALAKRPHSPVGPGLGAVGAIKATPTHLSTFGPLFHPLVNGVLSSAFIHSLCMFFFTLLQFDIKLFFRKLIMRTMRFIKTVYLNYIGRLQQNRGHLAKVI